MFAAHLRIVVPVILPRALHTFHFHQVLREHYSALCLALFSTIQHCVALSIVSTLLSTSLDWRCDQVSCPPGA